LNSRAGARKWKPYLPHHIKAIRTKNIPPLNGVKGFTISR
jgi:hypothetical protein